MPTLVIGEYRPDVSDLNQEYTRSVLNVFPRGDGYGPAKSFAELTDALPGNCRGSFFARNADGSVTVFAATETRLYQLDNTSLEWVDVSKGAADYSALSTDALWQFAQFNAVVIAVQANTVPQAFTLGSSSAFADLGGSPPQAAYIAVVGRFVVLSGLLSFPRRVQWSGLNQILVWTSGVAYSDSQDLPDGGNTRGVVGGEFGVIIQDSAIRRMTYQPGADVIFSIERLAQNIGTAFPYSLVEAEGSIFLHTTKGFIMLDAGGGMKAIGRERVDRTFLDDVDQTAPQLCIGAAKPGSNLVIWAYKQADFAGLGFNRALAYDVVLDRWSPLELSGFHLASFAKPGRTLESLDAIGAVAISNAADNGAGLVRLTVASTAGWATNDYKTIYDVGGTTEANGSWLVTIINGTTLDLQGSAFANAYTSGGMVAGSIDDLDISLDDFSSATLNQLGMISTDNVLGYFTGPNVEATAETSEQSGIKDRLFITGYFPVTDASDIYASVAGRENLNATPVYSVEQPLNAQGFCPQRVSTRHARAKLRVPAGAVWTFITGVDPEFTLDGER